MAKEPKKSPESRRVLLVEDDRLVLTMLEKGLRDSGYEVLAAESADEARQLLDAAKPDIAILDVRLPGESGIDLAKFLREDADVPFIFLTAYGDHETVEEAAARGALGYLIKPADIPQLLPAMEAALARAAEIRALRDSERQLQDAFPEVREINLAIGIVMERKGMDRNQAWEVLRALSRSQRRKVIDIAREILAATETLAHLVS
jgi:response regulator NasT